MTTSLPVITIWAAKKTPRLEFVLDWLFRERLGVDYELTHDAALATDSRLGLAYGFLEDVPGIHATSLLWETGIRTQEISQQEWQGLHTLFFEEASPCDIQFDMLSGIFYLLTRYEEYLPFAPDQHNRFPAEQSILYPLLERPIVDEWVEALRLFLEQLWSISIPKKPFSFQPSYDIDIAWSFRFKGWKRTVGAVLKDAAGGDWKRIRQRLQVSRMQQADPYDSFIWMLTQHMEGEPRPLYFILAALKPPHLTRIFHHYTRAWPP